MFFNKVGDTVNTYIIYFAKVNFVEKPSKGK
jgi:hypothetical protein